MRKIRETLRLHEECGRSQREIASSLSTAVGTICGYLQRARAADVTWELVQSMTDSEAEALLFRDCGRNQAARRAAIDYAHVHHELHKSTASNPRGGKQQHTSRAPLFSPARAATA